MAFSSAVVAVALIVGLVIGGAGVYVGTHSTSSLAASTVTVSTTNFSTVSVTVSSTANGSNTGLSVAQFQNALANTNTINLTVVSFDFGKGSLSVFFANSGTSPIVLSPSEAIYNGSASNANVYFSFVDPTSIRVGVYAYIPAGSQIFVSATPPNSPLKGQNATLQILNEQFTFTYGTSSP